MRRYNPKDIEPKWQKIWEESKLYSSDMDTPKPKYIGFGMFNYPSGAGIHVGHVRNYTIPDVITRAKRQQGFEAYQPVGWDSFGLPAENFAIKTGVSPQESTKMAIEKYRKQYKAMGWAVDWDKEINTTDPSYYKWTQWTFLKMFENKLAYQKESPQWWCPNDKTVLADEQVEGGHCWRCGHVVEKKNLKQWFFKITEYADEILQATDDLDWTEAVKASQRSWIGRSQGTLIDFKVDGINEQIQVFTTRPDTLFGVTYLVLAPEHQLVDKLTSSENKAQVSHYVKESERKSDLERQEGEKNKTGVFTGAFAINPINDQRIPIWIADYVLAGYGTGAIMAVPAHDERDYDFATKFNLPIQQVVLNCEDDSFNPPRPGFEEVERETVIVHLHDKSTGKYAILDWHESLEGITTAIMGGVEAGQTPEAAALNEIKEEAGIEGAVITSKLRWLTAAKYCASHKQQNRKAITHGFLAEIDNLNNQQPIADTEQKLHTLVWVDKADVANRLTPEHQILVWEQLWETTSLSGEGELINSGKYDGMLTSEAREIIVSDLSKKAIAKEEVNYKLRDWLISRQRYWGAPIPIIHCPSCGTVAVPEKELPVTLPEIKDYEPTGGNASVLASVADWVNTSCPSCGGEAKRETDTMDGYVCSSWYFMRYLSPKDTSQAWDPKLTEKWMPIDFYNGADHATAHLLYARFFTRFFYKLGLVSTPEPFTKMVYNGKVKASDGSAFSKSKGNGVDPLEIIEQGYGADALRLYEMFAAPVELDVLWDQQGVPGMHRFLSRIWTLTQEYLEAKTGGNNIESTELIRLAQKTAKKVTKHIETGKFNTALSSLMEMTNKLYKIKASEDVFKSSGWQSALETLVQLMAPFAPHITEELWHDLGHSTSVHISNWPVWDEQLIKDDLITLAVQINGKVRAEIIVAADVTQEEAVLTAKTNEKIALQLAGKTIKKEIYVPGRLVSLVV